MDKVTYYRVFDTQTGCYFATGYNATSMDELIYDFNNYILMDDEEIYLNTWDEISDYLQGTRLEESFTPFNESNIF
jgi:hypothetical protein